MEECSASDNEAPPVAEGRHVSRESLAPEPSSASQGSPASVRSKASGGSPTSVRLQAAEESETASRGSQTSVRLQASEESSAYEKSKAYEAAQSLEPSASVAEGNDIVVVFAGTPAVVPGPAPGACVVFEKHAPDGPPPATPTTPKHLPRLPPAFSRTLSMDPGVYGPRHSAGSEQPPPAYSDVVKTSQPQHLTQGSSVGFKIAQFALTVMCLILLSDGYRLEVNQNVTAMHFPFIVFSSFTLITGVILFGYIMGMKMRELLMRIFGTMGGLLFLISGIHTANRTYVFWDNWEGMIEEGDTDETDFSVTSIPRRRVCFVAQVVLSFVASVVYLSDVVFSYRRTMKMLN